MEYKAIINDGTGNVEINLSMDLYKSPLGFVGELNKRYPVMAGMPLAAEQLFAQSGLLNHADRDNGLVPAKIRSVLDDMYNINAASTAPGGSGISRFVAPAAVLYGVQNDIYEDKSSKMSQFRTMVGSFQNVNGTRYERPVFNYDAARAGRARPVAQLSEPTSVGLLTVGETSGTIPAFSYGLEISDQAMDYFTFAEVQKCMSIMVQEDLADRVDYWLMSMLNGDPDHNMSALASVSGAIEKAADYDDSITQNGVITNKAFIKWLSKHSTRAPITHIVTDIDTALLLESRSGRPTQQTDNPTSKRINTIEVVLNETWPASIPVLIVNNPEWPAGMLMGINKPSAIIMYDSASIAYNSVEQFVTRRSTKIRADFGSQAVRFFDRGFHCLSLTV